MASEIESTLKRELKQELKQLAHDAKRIETDRESDV